MNKFSSIRCSVLLITLILLSGCGSNPSVQVNEISRDTISYDETIHLNNCGGKADSEQTASRSFATTIEGGAEISAGYQSIVEGSISAKYSQYRNISKSQKLTAPPDTNMEFVLRWSEDLHSGNVTVNGKTGSYVVKVPVSVEQISTQDLGCNTTVQNPSPIPTQSVDLPAVPSSNERPSNIAVQSGGQFTPPGDWGWICTGDFLLTNANGETIPLHDQNDKSGGIVAIAPQSQVILLAPDGGSCKPYSPEERDSVISTTIALILADPSQCTNGCTSVVVYELDQSGNITNSYLKP
jgi:hypothetical protein